MPEPVDPLIGAEILGQYAIRKKLGAGAMGAVYLAEQTTVKRPAVIKVLLPGRARDEGVRARFEIEAQAASQLNHPHIVTIYNYGVMGDGTLFMAMEFIDGESLEERLTKGPMPVQRAALVADAIADALGEAHRRGVIHRDVKPSNVMLASRVKDGDFVKVLDFGVARLEGTEVTTTGMVCGTPKYMSPEQLRGEKIDGRADLYSLGVVLYELVTGRAPFSAENAMGYVYQHATVKPPRPSEVAPKAKIPPSLDAFLERALAKLPRDRPATAEIFRDELKRAIERATLPAISTTPQSERVGASVSGLMLRLGDEARALTAKVRPRKKPLFERVLNRLGVKRRRPWYRQPKWISVVCAAVAAIVCLAWLLLFWG